MAKVINRDFYLKQLIASQGNGLVKIITGVRRCGKSYLLNNLFYNYLLMNGIQSDHIIRFAFDSSHDLDLIGEDLVTIGKEKRKVDPHKFIRYTNTLIKDDEKYYLLLDEVQLLDSFEMVLIGFLRKDNIDVYVTGSNAKFLSKDIITEFAGRGEEIRMFPLSFQEFISTYDGDRYQALSDYMYYGGIPIVVLEENASKKGEILSRLFDEIYIRDIFQRHSIKSKSEFGDLLDILSSAIGSLTNPEKLSKAFLSLRKSKITPKTINNFLDYLEDSFMIEAVQRYDIKGKAYIGSPKKYYFSDLGLRNARINFRQIEQTHSLENVIYNELVRRGYKVDIGIVVENTRNKNNNAIRKNLEVDFVVNSGFRRYYIQSVYSMPDLTKYQQEVKPLLKIADSFKKIIITHDLTPLYYTDEGVLVMNIFDFLLDDHSLEK